MAHQGTVGYTAGNTVEPAVQGDGWQGMVEDLSADRKAFRDVSWGKVMMWLFLLSDTFVFGCFLTSYMTVRMSTTVAWPNASEVFALTIG